MKEIVYDGPQPSRTLELPGSNSITVERGVPVKVDDVVAGNLLEQRHFSLAKGRRKAKSKSPTLKDLRAEAAAAGVAEPEKLRTKKAAIQAIEAAKSAPVVPAAEESAPGESAGGEQKGE
jgi:hypothetical protein